MESVPTCGSHWGCGVRPSCQPSCGPRQSGRKPEPRQLTSHSHNCSPIPAILEPLKYFGVQLTGGIIGHPCMNRYTNIYCFLRGKSADSAKHFCNTIMKTYLEANWWTWQSHCIQRSKWGWRLWSRWDAVSQWHCRGWGWTQTPRWYSTLGTRCWRLQRFWVWGNLHEKNTLPPSPLIHK